MRSRILPFIFVFSTLAFAFDPGGPPPEKTVKWTTHLLSTEKYPTVMIKDTPIMEALELIRAGQNRPPEYAVSMDCSQMDAFPTTRVTIEAKDITILELLARFADQVNADLLIKPGTVLLVPRKGA